MKTLPDGGVELDGVRLTKEQVKEIRGDEVQEGWWVVDNKTKEPLRYLGRTFVSSDRGCIVGTDGRSMSVSNTPNVVFWGTF